jgi:aryl-alcohol dehydrogenase-like predicted oxidoreductase
MEYTVISGTDMRVSRIAQGTWAIGGWMWGGTDERESIRTIHAALDKGINLIDTAPVYGFGVSEEIVGKAIEERGHREKVFIATKVGLEWHDGSISRATQSDALWRRFSNHWWPSDVRRENCHILLDKRGAHLAP